MIQIRKPKEIDLIPCLELMAMLGPRYTVDPGDSRAKALFQRYMKHEDKLGFIAVDEKDAVVGCLFIEIGYMFCQSFMQGRGEGMVIAPGYRGQGVGKRLLGTMLAELEKRGVSHCVIRAPYDWGSYQMYQKLEGWHERGGYFYYYFDVKNGEGRNEHVQGAQTISE